MNEISDLLSMDVVSEITDKFKDAVVELKELDSILNQIKTSSSNLSDSDLASIAERSFTVASQYGKTAKDYLTTVQSLAEAGSKNAGHLAELSLALQSAGGITSELANEYLLAADRSYNLGGNLKELTTYLDGITSVSESNSLSLGKLAENMSIVSSHAADAGVGMDEATAAMATMMSASGESGTEIANAFSNILSSLSQVTDAPMDMLEELAQKYNSLSENDIEKTELLSSLGGDIDTSAMEALFENWNTYEQMLADYQNGIGSLTATAGESVDTWEGSMNRLSNTWTDTVGNIADSEGVTTLINTFTDLLSVINHITESIGPLASIAAISGGILGAKNAGN